VCLSRSGFLRTCVAASRPFQTCREKRPRLFFCAHYTMMSHPSSPGRTKGATCQTPQCTLLHGHDGAHSFEMSAGRSRVRKVASSFDPSELYSEDWLSGTAPSETLKTRRRSLEKRTTLKSGEVHAVDKLLARRGDGAATRYLVRWQGADPRDDTWEKPENIGDPAIEAFVNATNEKATVFVRGAPQLWLVETVLDRRVGRDGQKESKIRFVGYGSCGDEWVNDNAIQGRPEPPPAVITSTSAAPTSPQAQPAPAASPPPAKRARAASTNAVLPGSSLPASQAAASPAAPTKRAKAAPSAVSAVEGLKALLAGVDEEVHAAALRWCRENNVQKAALIAELHAEEDLIAALPINPAGLGANALRVRLARMRQAIMV
jgi:hypothetical protein